MTTDREGVPQPAEWESIEDILRWADHAAEVGNIYIAVDLRRVLSRHVLHAVPPSTQETDPE